MDKTLSSLPLALLSCTNTISLNKDPGRSNPSYSDVAKCFMYARRSSDHTQPLPSSMREMKRAFYMLGDTQFSHLEAFFQGYVHPYGPIPETVLDAIRIQCINTDCKAAYRHQMRAFHMLCDKVRAKRSATITRSKPDEPESLSKLRQVLLPVKHVPKVSVKDCHFSFVGVLPSDPGLNEQAFAASVNFQNNGQRPFTLKVTQTQTVVDGVRTESRSFQGPVDSYQLNPGESIDLGLAIKKATRLDFTEFQQILVISINEVLKIFVTFLVLLPQQRLFGQHFPSCMPLSVLNSPLGPYTAPFMLQIFKHVFISQNGLSSPAAIRLMVDKSIYYKSQNQEVMCEVAHVKELLQEQLNPLRVLNSFWDSLQETEGVSVTRRCRLPSSLAQPYASSYAAGLPIFSSSTGSGYFFPNKNTQLPDCLIKAPPEVTMGLILLWLADMDESIFEAPFDSNDYVAYLASMPLHMRGVVLWILDLCCALLHNCAENGATGRGLALTFVNILIRRKTGACDDGDMVTLDGGLPRATASFGEPLFLYEVGQRQSAVTAFLHWLKIYACRYEKVL